MNNGGITRTSTHASALGFGCIVVEFVEAFGIIVIIMCVCVLECVFGTVSTSIGVLHAR